MGVQGINGGGNIITNRAMQIASANLANAGATPGEIELAAAEIDLTQIRVGKEFANQKQTLGGKGLESIKGLVT